MLIETKRLQDLFDEEFEYARCTCNIKDEQFIRTFFSNLIEKSEKEASSVKTGTDAIIRTPHIKDAIVRDIA